MSGGDPSSRTGSRPRIEQDLEQTPPEDKEKKVDPQSFEDAAKRIDDWASNQPENYKAAYRKEKAERYR